ncbi:MAG: hypothetical protein ACJAW3_000817 [Lentimonas sp.]|jgi:hypothetical protein
MIPIPLDLISDMMSLGSGGLPIGSMRMIPKLFRKKGLTKAQIKKLMMRRRRVFVDNVVMIHERRVQKQGIEDRIKEVKEELRKKKKKIIPRKKMSAKPSSRPNSMRGRYGSDISDEDKKEEQEERLNTFQQIIASRAAQEKSQTNKASNTEDRLRKIIDGRNDSR